MWERPDWADEMVEGIAARERRAGITCGCGITNAYPGGHCVHCGDSWPPALEDR